MFITTVPGGLFIHGIIVLPRALSAFRRVNPFAHMRNMHPAPFNAFSTASSSARIRDVITARKSG
ncbi:MAG TPA: cation:dicarboxylase symporter family transporter [Spirochaetota bacterium]|nr:cation:dicarboxylase symporter family transporter [Spirochaetota bacterium]